MQVVAQEQVAAYSLCQREEGQSAHYQTANRRSSFCVIMFAETMWHSLVFLGHDAIEFLGCIMKRDRDTETAPLMS